MKTFGRRQMLWRCLPLLGAAVALAGCGRAAAANRARFYVVLIDETASFAPDWQPATSALVRLASQLRAHDQIEVIGIDNHAWDDEDVRIPPTQVPAGLASFQMRAKLITDLKALKARKSSSGWITPKGTPRGTPPGTDLAGALDFAAHAAERADGRTVHLLVLSDFAKEKAPTNPGGRKIPGAFPQDASFTGLFVSIHGGNAATKNMDYWVSALARQNVQCSPRDFFLPSDASTLDLSKR